jgi:hypothetical protein
MRCGGALLIVLLSAACRDVEDPKKASGATETEIAPARSAAAAPLAGDDLAEKLRHCPLTVPGVKGEIVDVEGGVRVTVRAASDPHGDEVRRRAQHLVDFTAGRAARGTHGGGAGGGFMRNCPIVTKDTRIEVENIERGAIMTVTASDPAGVDPLRIESRARLARLPPPDP